jgi:hypothetical protein
MGASRCLTRSTRAAEAEEPAEVLAVAEPAAQAVAEVTAAEAPGELEGRVALVAEAKVAQEAPVALEGVRAQEGARPWRHRLMRITTTIR